MITTTKNFIPLPQESAPYTKLLEIRPIIDLTESTVSTVHDFRVTIPAHSRIVDIVAQIDPLGDISDAAYDDVTITIGDSAGLTTFATSRQIARLAATPVRIIGLNKMAGITLTSTDGTAAAASANLANLAAEAEKIGDDVRAMYAALITGKVYPSADYLRVVVTPKTGKKISDLDQGVIRIFVVLQTNIDLLG